MALKKKTKKLNKSEINDFLFSFYRYPQPKESTHKIRGKSDIIEMLCGSVDQELLTVKSFYFFFYSAFGSLFPLMGIYFKQMGMNPGQCGVLIGTRPFVEFLSAPFWGSYADRYLMYFFFSFTSLSILVILYIIKKAIKMSFKKTQEKISNSLSFKI